jgi:DNA-binding GntR family transcriptional regulator
LQPNSPMRVRPSSLHVCVRPCGQFREVQHGLNEFAGMIDRVEQTPEPASGDVLYESAYRTLRRAMLVGAFEPGQKITIRNLARTLGLSMTPAREALRRLVAEKALELRRNRRSVRVPIPSIERLSELWKVRLALEGLAAEAAGSKAARSDIDNITVIQMRLAAARQTRDHTSVMLQNFEFHQALYRLAKMPYLLSLIEGIWLNVGPLLNELYRRRRGSQLFGDAHHAEALRALRSGDAKGVRKAIERDLLQALPHVLEIVKSFPSEQKPVVRKTKPTSKGKARVDQGKKRISKPRAR